MALFGPGLGPYMEAISEQVYDAVQGLGGQEKPTFDLDAR